MVIATPNISKALRIFPIPKYLSIKNIIMDKDRIIPLLVFAKIVENVKRRERNRLTKKARIINALLGSKKYIIKILINQNRIVIAKVGKKFFLDLIFLFLSSFI